MIAQLHGILLEATLSVAVLDVSGIGFEVGISGMTAASLPPLGEEVRLYTRMRIGNDAVALFGFATVEERTMFDRLIAVSSVGPRLALAVLSKYSVSQIYSIVMAETCGHVCGAWRGEKRRERLILELKGTLAKTTASLRPMCPPQVSSRSAALPRHRLTTRAPRLPPFPWASARRRPTLPSAVMMGMRVEDLLAAALKRLGMDA